MNWNANLEFVPIVTPDGENLITLQDAANYLLDHPNETAAGELLKAANAPSQFFCHCARQAVSIAVHGAGRQEPVTKETWRDKRKKARNV